MPSLQHTLPNPKPPHPPFTDTTQSAEAWICTCFFASAIILATLTTRAWPTQYVTLCIFSSAALVVFFIHPCFGRPPVLVVAHALVRAQYPCSPKFPGIWKFGIWNVGAGGIVPPCPPSLYPPCLPWVRILIPLHIHARNWAGWHQKPPPPPNPPPKPFTFTTNLPWTRRPQSPK